MERCITRALFVDGRVEGPREIIDMMFYNFRTSPLYLEVVDEFKLFYEYVNLIRQTLDMGNHVILSAASFDNGPKEQLIKL